MPSSPSWTSGRILDFAGKTITDEQLNLFDQFIRRSSEQPTTAIFETRRQLFLGTIHHLDGLFDQQKLALNRCVLD
jgi:hypothetical protein